MSNYDRNHGATIGFVLDAVADAYEKMQDWVQNNADKLDAMKHIGNLLNSANRVASDNRTVAERAQALVTSIDAIVTAMTECGVDMNGITTAQIAQFITTIANNAGVWIEDTDGLLWTAASWAYEKQRAGGVDPATFQGIVLTNSEHEFYIASRNYGPMQFGTFNHTIPKLQSMDNGPSGTPVSGEYNGRMILAATNPEALRRFGYAIDYRQGLTRADLTDANGLKVNVVFFDDLTTLTDWATDLGVYEMQAIGSSMIYAVLVSDDDPNNKTWCLKYFNGVNSISFANREAVVPYTDTYGQIGCPPANACASHTEYTGDTLFWRNPSLFECLMMILNKEDINACRTALDQVSLPSGSVWSCLQNGNNGGYYFSLADGSWLNNSKNTNYNVVPVASRHSA